CRDAALARLGTSASASAIPKIQTSRLQSETPPTRVFDFEAETSERWFGIFPLTGKRGGASSEAHSFSSLGCTKQICEGSAPRAVRGSPSSPRSLKLVEHLVCELSRIRENPLPSVSSQLF